MDSATISYGSTPTTLTATVSYTTQPTPTGAVTFTVDSGSAVTASCTGSASPLTCTASYPTGTLALRSHTITVSEAADTSYVAASNTGTLTVIPATTTTLSIRNSSNVPTSSITAGSEALFQITFTSGSTTLTTGQVNLCDATAAYCTDVHLLGTAQLTSSGDAVIALRPSVGSHSYYAMFVRQTNLGSSTSAGVPGLKCASLEERHWK